MTVQAAMEMPRLFQPEYRRRPIQILRRLLFTQGACPGVAPCVANGAPGADRFARSVGVDAVRYTGNIS
jgi:hypothetical protein